jgi:hypothetical protein
MTMSMPIERGQKQRGEDNIVSKRQSKQGRKGVARGRGREIDVATMVSALEVQQRGLVHASRFSTNGNR